MLEEVKKYIDEVGLNTSSRKRQLVDKRTYMFAYMYYVLGMEDMGEIGSYFGKDRTTVLFHVKKYDSLKNDNEFILNTKSTSEIFPIGDVERYVNRAVGARSVDYRIMPNGNYEVTIQLTRAQGKKFLRTKDSNFILEILFRQMIRNFNRKTT